MTMSVWSFRTPLLWCSPPHRQHPAVAHYQPLAFHLPRHKLLPPTSALIQGGLLLSWLQCKEARLDHPPPVHAVVAPPQSWVGPIDNHAEAGW